MEKEKIKLLFDEPTHTYKDNTGKLYTSVTTLIENYTPTFNKRYWSMYTALKNNGFRVKSTQNEKGIFINGVYRSLESLYNNPIAEYDADNTIKTWKEITEEACDRGNKIHNYLEDSINQSKGDDSGITNELIKPLRSSGDTVIKIETEHDLYGTGLQDTYPTIFKVLLAFINQGCILFAEKKIFNTYYAIAGTIDVLVVKGKQFAIVDWKTNKDKIHFVSGYYKKVNMNGKWVKSEEFTPYDKRLLTPIDYLQNCKGVKYSLQLTLYAFLMELWGYKLIDNGLIIFHLRPNMTPKKLNIKYHKEDIIRVLEHHRNKTNKQPNLFGIT